jgi:hypothetical protein
MLPRLALTVVIGMLACPMAAQSPAEQSTSPQSASSTAPPAYVAITEGVAMIEHAGVIETSPLNMPIVSGDRLRTTEGRMEVRFADSSALDLDARTVVDTQSDSLLRLIDGRIRITLRSTSGITRIDSPAGSARLAEPGEYRLALVVGPRQAEGDVQLEFVVVRGSGEIVTDQGKTTVRAGERAYASADLLPSEPYPFNSATMDDFDRWPASPTPVSAEPSEEYLPTDLQSYSSTLDAYGDWLYIPAYGHVWCPRVTGDWRPYAFGRWMTYPRYGLTWIGSEPFAWPTHHYGRWGTMAGRWFWIPSSHWAPAHVAWSSTGDSVSWSPLGPNNRTLAGSSARTVMSRADFDHHFVVQTAPVINQARSAAIDQTHMGLIDSTRRVPAPTTRTTGAPTMTIPRAANQTTPLTPPRTTPPAHPLPRSQARRPQSPITQFVTSPPSSSTGPAGPPANAPQSQPPAAQPSRGAQPPSAAQAARGTQPHPVTQPSRGAQPQPANQPSPAAQPAATVQPAAKQPAAQQPAHPAPRGRGGV